jgi:chemotaxis protein methyltransferase CheR
MIYFAPKACRHLIGRLHRSLGDGGWLVVGATESSEENFRAFRTVNVAGASVHQKAAPERRAHPQSQTKTAPAEPLPMVAGAPDAADEEGLRRLADRGDWQSAAEYVKKLPEGDRLNPAIHFYRALIFENLGIADEAERWLRQAIYLDRGFAMAHYHLGLRLKKDGQPNLAARSFRNVVSVLAGRPGDETVPAGDGVTAARMTELARMNLEDKSGF